jgi:CheY-like chemotaxis protein
VTLDLVLPDMSGQRVLAAIRETELNASVPAVVITVSAERGATRSLRIADFLVKPVDDATLLDSLRRAGVAPDETRPVLVVDDDPAALATAAAALAPLGYRPLCASSAEEGLRATDAQPPAAVVLDLLMPGMDGFEFAERFREKEAARGVPIIVWTSKDLTDDDRRRLRETAQGVVMKRGTTVEDLVDELRACGVRDAG